MAIRMRIGTEDKFDANKMVPGEWAVSTDKKYVRMCFSPGVVARMATYEAFEEDMREVQTILATCRDIQTAVEAFEQLAEQHKSQAEEWSNTSESWAVGGTGTRTGENTNNSQYYSEQARKYKEAAEKAKEDAEKIVFNDTVPISKGGTGATEAGEATNNLVAQSLAPSIYIPANSDLNDYIVPGCYSVLDSTVSKTIANTPVTGAGYMLSVYIPNGAKSLTKSRVQIVQLFYAATYARYRDNSGVWSNWIQRKYTDTTYSSATQSTNGLMSAADKKKMDGIAEGANKTTLTANLLATVPGTALDATMGKQLKDELNSINTSLSVKQYSYGSQLGLGVAPWSLFNVIDAMPAGSVFTCDAANITDHLDSYESNMGIIRITKTGAIRVLCEYFRLSSTGFVGRYIVSLNLNSKTISSIDVLPPAVAGISPNTAYVELKTANGAKKYTGANLAVLGGSFQVTTTIPASTVIILATVGEAIKPVCQHNVSLSNDHFITMACWIGINGTLVLYSQAAIPVGTYIHFSDCYVYQ